jgi:hypothetical protein
VFHLSLAVLLGFALGLVVSLRGKRQLNLIGDELHLSLDKFDQDLLAAGKLANARLSKVEAVAKKAYGDLNLSVIVKKL